MLLRRLYRTQSHQFASVFLVVTLLTAGAAHRCFAQDNETVLKLYQEAKAAEQNGQYAQAIQSYERIVALRPDLAEAYANLGNLYYIQRQYDKAERSFRTSLKLKPQLAGPSFFLGVLAFRSRDWPVAVKHLTRAAQLEPANVMVRLQLGFTFYASGEYEKAISNLESAARAEQDNADAWYHLSKLYGQISRRYFDQLQLKSPDSYYTHLARAHFFEGQSGWQEAAAEYEKALQQRDSAGLRTKLLYVKSRAEGKQPEWSAGSDEVDGSTRLLYQPPRIEEALQEFWRRRDKLMKSSTEEASPERLYSLAEENQLLSYLASLWLIGSNPESYRAHQLKGQSLEAAGRNEEAVTEYRTALSKKPELPTVHFAIGSIYWRGGQFDQALPELKAELELSPNDPQAHYEIADILLTQGDVDEAATHYQKCLQHAPETVEAHLALERIYTSKGQTDKSVFHLTKAAVLAPRDATPHYRLWLLYRKLGKTAEADRERKLFEQLKKATVNPSATMQ